MIDHRMDAGAMGARPPGATPTPPKAGDSARLAHAPKFSLTVTIVAFCIFLLGLLWGAVVVQLRDEREAEIGNAMKHTANLARAFDEHTMRLIHETDQLLRFLDSQYRAQGRAIDLPGVMADGAVDGKIYNQISVIGENGDLLMSAEAFRSLNIADSETFKAHAERHSGQVFFSKPLLARTTGKWSVFLSRRINKPDGSFGGIVSAGMDPAYFSRFYADLDLGKRGVVTLVGRDDGIVRARRSGEDVTIGQDLRKASLFAHLGASPSGSYQIDRSVIDGVPRIYSYRALKSYPLVIAVGIATDEALAPFNARMRQQFLAAALASLVILGCTTFLLALVSRREAMASILRQQYIDLTGSSEASARLAAIVETTHDAIISCAPDGTVLSWNTGAEKMLGYAAAAMIGRNVSVIAPPDRQHEVRHHAWLLQHGKSVPPFETIRIASDGRPVDVQMSMSAIRDAAGGITQIAYIFRDVTDRKRAGAERTQLLNMLEASLNEIYIFDCETLRFRYVNSSALRNLCYSAEAMQRMTPCDLKTEFNEQSFRAHVAPLLRGERELLVFESAHRRADGTSYPVEVHLQLVGQEESRVFLAVIFDITDRKQANITLRESEERFRATFEQAAVGIAHVAPDGRWLRVNRKLCDIVGYSREELLQKTFQDITHPDDLDTDLDQVRRMLGREINRYSMEKRYFRKSGEVVWINLTVSLLWKPSGEPDYFISVVEEISERKRGEADLARLAAIVESSRDAIVSLAPDGTILTWNIGAEHMFGHTAAEAVGRNISSLGLIPDDRRDEFGKTRTLALAGQKTEAFETERLAKDGHRISVSISSSPIRDSNGNIAGVASIYNDITERKRAEQTRAQLAAIVEGSNDAIVGRALDGTIISWNAAAERLLGWRADEVIGQPIATILLTERRDRPASNNERLLRDETITPSETRRVTKDGRIIDVLSSVSPVRDAHGNLVGAAMTIRDNTELKRAQCELERKAALTRVMESLAHATNEAATVEDALRLCVARICDYGGWMLGRVGTFASGQRMGAPQSSVWYCPQPAHFTEFIENSNHYTYTGRPSGQFVSEALRERRPVWVSDFSTTPGFGRLAEAVKCGIRSGFVFPIVVGDESLAFLEFFAGDAREPDALFLEAITVIGSQLARVIERQRALEEARASEQKLGGILGALHEVVWSMDARSGCILYLNAAAKRLARRSVTDFLANKRTWRRMVHPDDRAQVRSSVRALLEQDALIHEFRIVLADGEVRVVENRARVMRDENGKPQRIDGTLNDITERRHAESEIGRMAAIVESSNDAIISRGLDRTILTWNPAAERLFGWSAAEAIGKSIWLIVPPERRGENDSGRELVHQGIAVPSFDTVRVAKDGRLVHVSMNQSAVRNERGEVIGVSVVFRDITERKRAEAERALLAAIVESSDDAIIGRSLDGTITSWNAAAERLYGYTAAEAIGRRALLLTSPELHEETERNRRLLRQGLSVPPYETVRLTKDGRRIDVQLSLSPVRDRDGVVIGQSSNSRDITERKQAEAARARLAAIVEHSADAIISRGTDGTILSWNPAAERLFGWSVEEAVGNNISIFIPPGRGDEVRRNMEKLHRGEPVAAYDTVRRKKDGQLFDAALTQSPIKNERGEVTAVSLIFRDITERKRADIERAQLAAIVESTSDAVISRDMDGNILSWNAAAERLFGWSAKEAIGQPIKSLIVPLEHRGALRPLIERVMRGEAVPAIEHTQLRKDGARVDVSITFSAVRDAQGNIIAVAGILRDIRPQKAAEREIKHKAQLAQLLEGLARAVNEADTPEAAMQACVARICDYGGWNLGRAGIFGQGQFKGVPRSSIWHCPQSVRFEEFMRTSNNFDYGVPSGRFVSAALREMKLVWVSDFSAMPGPGRLADAGQFGIRAGFVFPVVVGNEVAAFLEFFADGVREPDVPFLEAIATVSSQLARVIERQRAASTLKESEERFRAAFEQAGVGMGLRAIDPRNPRWLRVNQKLCEIFGYTRDELLQRTTVDLTPPEDRGTAIDYNEKLLRGEVASYSREKRYLHKDGSIIWTKVSIAAVRGPEGRPTHAISVIEDITEHKKAEERAGFLAHYDVVTGLPNRQLFTDRLTLAMARDKRLGTMTALLLLDLDRFKLVNETLGHGAGDEVLQMVTARLRECLREVDTIARLGGDEFVVILESVAETAHALRVAEKIMAAMAEPLALKGEEVFITASIGIALYPADADGMEKLIECAELAMYQAKKEGRNTVQLYTPDRESRRGTGLGMESRLRRALERDELLLHFQPKVDVRTGSITSAEALVRWHNPDLGLVSPADFIPLAEETGLIVPIGEWVLHSACTQASAWRREGHPLSVAVNLSARQFRQNELCETVERALADSALEAGRLELEITESMIMHRPEQTIATLQRLHGIGVKLSVDDFGTGYSSLSYLKRFPVHTLKIDQSFVRELHKNADDAAIVRAVIALAQNLNLKTVAEGVETEQQLIFLAGLHCDEYQGYYFSKPLPADDFLRLLRERSTASPVSPIRQPAKAAPSQSRQASKK